MEPLVEVSRQNTVGIIRLVDEAKRNSLSTRMREEFVAAYRDVVDDPDVRAIYLTAKGKAFCGGGDLGMMRDESDPWSSHQRLNRTCRWMTELIECPKPLVVGVNGVAVGGGIGLALAGDVILAAEHGARFVSGFSRLGLLPDIGVMYTLPRFVGMARAKAFVFNGETWTAHDALQAGLVTAVVPDEGLDKRGIEQAQALAAGPVESFGLVKQLMGRSFETPLERMMTYEDLGQSLAYATEAMREGLAALTERRAPDFITASERETATRIARSRRP